MKKKLYLKKGIEKNMEIITLANIILVFVSFILTLVFNDIESLHNYYVKLYIVNNIMLLINGYILIKFTKKYQIIFK